MIEEKKSLKEQLAFYYAGFKTFETTLRNNDSVPKEVFETAYNLAMMLDDDELISECFDFVYKIGIVEGKMSKSN